MPRTKRSEGVKRRIIGMRDAGMKQVDIAGALNVSQTVVSRLLKKHRETGSFKNSTRSTLILGCMGLLLKRHGVWCIFLRPHAAVGGSTRDFEFSIVPGRKQENDVRPSLNSPECQSVVLEDDNTKSQRARIIEEYKNLQNIASLPLPSLSPDLNPIEHLWDELGRRVRNWEPAVSTLRELHKALLEEWVCCHVLNACN